MAENGRAGKWCADVAGSGITVHSGHLDIHLLQAAPGITPGYALDIQLAEDHIQVAISTQRVMGIVDVTDHFDMKTTGSHLVRQLLGPGGIIVDD